MANTEGGPFPKTWKARRYGGTVPAGSRETSADDRLQRVTKGAGLVRSHLNDETATTLERDAHHDAAPFLGDLQRTIARPRLHRRHLVSPQTYIRVGGLPHSHYINVACSAPRDARISYPTGGREGHTALARGPAHRADQTFSLMNTGEPKPSPGGCDSV